MGGHPPAGTNRIGLFGGTFDPIHMGHLQVAEEVRNHFDMEEIFMIPAALPPHKTAHRLASARDRKEMILRALSRYPGLSVSDVELNRSGPSYTVDTINYFKERLGNGTELFFILGIDAFWEIDTWKSFKILFDLIPFIVMSRPGSGFVVDPPGIEKIEAFIKTQIDPDYRPAGDGTGFFHPDKQRICVHDTCRVDVSSTQIRRCIGKGLSIEGFVPERVKQYIEKKGLYDDRRT